MVAKFDIEVLLNQRGGRSTGDGWVSKGRMGNPDGQIGWNNVLAVDSSVMFMPTEPAKAYAMSGNGKVFRKDNIDVVGAWDEPGQWPVSDVRQIAVNSLHSERLYAITGSKVGRSITGGATWTDVGAGSLPSSEFNSIVVDPRIATRLYLGADIGVFVSNDEGDTWLPYDNALPNAEVFQIFSTGNYLYAVTHGRGLWRRRPC